MPAKEDATGSVRDTLRIYWRMALRHKKYLILAFMTPLGGVLMTVLMPFFASKILAGIVQGETALTTYLTLFALSAALGVAANRIGFANNMELQARTMTDLNHTVFERLLRRSLGYHSNRVSGKLVSDALDFVTSFGQLTNVAFVNGLNFAFVIVIGLSIVLVNSWQLGLFVALTVAGILTWTAINSRNRSRLRQKRLKATKKLTSHLSDSIVNAQTVKTFAQEKVELRRNKQLNKQLESLRIRDWRRAGRSGSNRMAALLAMQFCLMLLVIHLTRRNPAILATGIFAFTYTLTLTNRLFEVDNMTRQVEEALLNASPMAGMLNEVVEIQDKPGAAKLKTKYGKVDLRDVSFAYPDNAQNGAVFKRFNLTARSGEKVGLVGPSGGGKSTLTRLLLRFEEPDGGQILIDEQDIANVTQESLRAAVSYVPQEPLLFHRSIRENIAYGQPSASDEDIVKSAEQANAHEFIKDLPESYDTVVGERGVKLSGGQRQRVAIARAILKNAPILILDEATSALDSENEQQVQEALWHLMQGRTAIVIAHRLSTIQKMDRIVVLADGKIKEEGTHQQLIKNNALYAKLWKHQSGGFIEE